MNILVDENIPRLTIEALRGLGHDVLHLHGTPEQGISDEVLWLRAQAAQRMVLTTDKGFASHRDELHSGLLIVRLRQPNEQ
jgi:predicted nuclease of predicted toxin-antitoxin system